MSKYEEKAEYYRRYHQYVVMTKPHDNLDSLLVQVKNYIESNDNYDSIRENGYYECFFYKETWNTPRDYKEDPRGYFTFDEIGHHIDDLILSVEYRKERKAEYGKKREWEWEYNVKTHNDPDKWVHYHFTKDGEKKK